MERLSTDDEREALVGGETRLTRAQARDLLFRLADAVHLLGGRWSTCRRSPVRASGTTGLPKLAVHRSDDRWTLRTVGKASPAMEVETRDGDMWVRGPFVMEGSADHQDPVRV